MATARAERRLAAILAADVVGYSRLVEHDEAGTLSALKVLRREVIDPLLAEPQGRIVKLMGDGALVEFGSVVMPSRARSPSRRALPRTRPISQRSDASSSGSASILVM
jgi:class 3 adenylate cyclase